MLGLSFSSKLDWGSYIVSVDSIDSIVSGRSLIRFVKFFPFEFRNLKQKSPVAASLEPSAHRRNVASLSFFSIVITLEVVYQNWLDLFHFLILVGGLLVFLIGCMIFCHHSQVLKDLYINSFFPCTARPWNFLPAACFPLTYYLNGFKSLLWADFPIGFSSLSSSPPCNSMPGSGCLALCGVNTS